MTVYGKAVLILLAAVATILTIIFFFSEDMHFRYETRVKIMAVLQTACTAALIALFISIAVYIDKVM